MNKDILRGLTYGVYILSSLDNERKVGCVINSAMQITSSPITIAISVNHDNYTNKCIKSSNLFSLSILNEETDPKLIGKFGYKSSCDINKFDGVDYDVIDGVPVIKDSCGYLVCKVVSELETETHTIFIGEVISMNKYNDNTPMTYSYYHKVIKGKTPKNAPTYIEDNIKDEIANNKWRCRVCGYIYEGDSLPDNFKCPICGVSKEMFEKV